MFSILSFRFARQYLIRRSGLCTKKVHFITIPDIMDSKTGVVEKWLKKEGEHFKVGDSICEVSLSPSDLMVAVDAHEDGIIAKLLTVVGQTVAVHSPIVEFVHTKEEYFEYIDALRIAEADSEKGSQVEAAIAASHQKPDNKVLLRVIKNLLHDGKIKEGTDFAKKLQSLARKGNPQLMATFEASCEGDSFNEDTFDEKFFLDNAADVVSEIEHESASQGPAPAPTSV